MARYSRWFAIGLPRGGDRELSKITFAVFLALAGYELEPFSTESQRTVLCATIATISTIVRDTDTITKIFCHSDHLIDLEIKGFHSCVLDCLQPPITVEEYYLYDPDYPIIYECHIEFLGEKGNLIDTFHFCDTIRDNKQWIYVSHTFKNYGPGLRKINYTHNYLIPFPRTGVYYCKVAGAYIYMQTIFKVHCVLRVNDSFPEVRGVHKSIPIPPCVSILPISQKFLSLVTSHNQS